MSGSLYVGPHSDDSEAIVILIILLVNPGAKDSPVFLGLHHLSTRSSYLVANSLDLLACIDSFVCLEDLQAEGEKSIFRI